MRQKYQFHKILCYATYGIIGTTAATGLVLSNIFFTSVYAEEVDEVVIDVPASCTFAAGGGGTYNVEIDNDVTEVVTANNITTSCNDISGYAIYAIGFSGDSYSGNNTDLISTLNSNYNIKTDGSGTYGSSWKMKITAVSNATVEGSYSTFQNIPASYAKVASFNASTTNINSTITPSYQVNISATQIADTYTGKVKYTLVHPSTALAPVVPLSSNDCPANSICYAPNASDIEGSMSSVGPISSSLKAGKQTLASNAVGAVLIAPNYKREGYGFAGWSTDFTATNASTIYGPNQTVTLGSGSGYDADISTNGLILYPVWVASAGNMQGWTGCSGMTAATYDDATGVVSSSLANITALTDTRDGNVYTVAKLVDGVCWMMENLRLNAENTRGTTNKSKAQGYGESTTYGNFIGLADSEDSFTATDGITDSTSANSIYYAGTQSGTASIDISQTDYAGYRIPRYNNNNTNMADGATNSDGVTALVDSYSANNNHSRWYSYGNYYNWPAAVANTSYTYTDVIDDSTTSICPSGWKLPLGDTSTGTLADGINDSTNRVGSFSYLDRKIGGTGSGGSGTNATTQAKKLRSFPNNFVKSGYWENNATGRRNSDFHYWSSSSSTYGINNAFFLRYSAASTVFYYYPNGYATKNHGFTVRCIASS